MELPLSLEEVTRAIALCEPQGTAARRSRREVIGFYLEHEARFVDAVKRGITSADRGNFIEHE